MTVQARHLRSVAEWASCRPAYVLKIGSTPIGFDALAPIALADLRSRIAADVRRERRARR